MSDPKPRMPRTRAEWQEAVDGAYFLLWLDAARQYGLVEGGPGIDQERCAYMIELGKGRGIRPSPDVFERGVKELL
jgi:hypothetical protein